MNFPAILVTLTIVTGIIWLAEKIVWSRNRPDRKKPPAIIEHASSFFPIILIVLVIRSFIVEPFRIPSASMLPTLYVGDFILVNKFTYGIRLPVINYKIIPVGSPERGDVFVFRYPKDTRVDYIKRIIGLPGDKITYVNKRLYVNGKLITRDLKRKDKQLLAVSSGRFQLYAEHLGDNDHDILLDPTSRQLVRGEMIVPEGHYFAMGDNRDNSNDSRFWGTVPEENLVGKAFFIWMSWDWDEGGIVWERLGNSI